MDWTSILNTIMPYILTFVFSLLADKYLVDLQKKQKAVLVVEYAETAVRFVEDFYQNNPGVIKGVEKAMMAIKWVKSAMKTAGYPMNDAGDDEFIQGHVASAYQKTEYSIK